MASNRSGQDDFRATSGRLRVQARSSSRSPASSALWGSCEVAQLGRSARLANLGRGRANLHEPGMDRDRVLEGWHLPDDTPVS